MQNNYMYRRFKLKFISVVLMMVLFPVFALCQTLDQKYIGTYNALNNGSTCDSTTLNTAIADGRSANKNIIVAPLDKSGSSCTWNLSADVTMGAAQGLMIPKGTLINVNSTKTLTSCIETGEHQIFSGVGAVVIPLGCTNQVKAIWWPRTAAGLSKADAAAVASNLPLVFTNGTWGIETNLTLNSRIEIQEGAVITVNDDVTLTFAKSPKVNGYYKVFTANGDTTGRVVYTKALQPVSPDHWGADSTGTNVDTEVYINQMAYALPSTGSTVLYNPSGHYKYGGSTAEITKSNILFDGQNSLHTATTTARYFVNGDNNAPGDYSTIVKNVHFRNFRFGSANDASNKMLPPSIYWAEYCSIERFTLLGSERGSGAKLGICNNCRVAHAHIEGGHSVTISVEFHLTNNSVLEDITFQNTNALANLQIKGGKGNIVNNVRMYNNTLNDDSWANLFIRGDSPYQTSQGGELGIYYPYASISSPVSTDCTISITTCWEAKDPRRASIGTRISNVVIVDSPNRRGVLIQEDYNTSLTNFYIENTKRGIKVQRGSDSDSVEKNVSISNGELENIGTTAGDDDAGYGIWVTGGSEPLRYVGAKITGVTMRNIQAHGILLDWVNNARVSDSYIYRPGLGGVETSGIRVGSKSSNTTIIGNTIEDDQGTPTMVRGIDLPANVTLLPTVVSNSVKCPSCAVTWQPIFSPSPGKYADNSPGWCIARTTNNTPTTTRCVVSMENFLTYALKLEVECNARHSTANRAFYLRRVVTTFNDGDPDVLDTTAITGDITQETDTDWNVTLTDAQPDVQIRLTGDTGQNVDWVCNPKMTLITLN